MSKIGRKPINTSGLTIDINGKSIVYKGSHASGTYLLPEELSAQVEDNNLVLIPSETGKLMKKRELNRVWGLHRALLSNALGGAQKEFEKLIEIVGLGFKVAVSGQHMIFSLGYSHKVDYEFPKGVSVSVDKTGQKITVKSSDKELVGSVCSKIKALRSPEPYKGTGIRFATDKIKLKAGKAKSAGA